MKVLHTFSEKEKSYHLYQARLNYVREQQTLEAEHENRIRLVEEQKERAEARAEDAEAKTKVIAREAQAKVEKAQVEQERLKALLRAQGIDPESI